MIMHVCVYEHKHMHACAYVCVCVYMAVCVNNLCEVLILFQKTLLGLIY